MTDYGAAQGKAVFILGGGTGPRRGFARRVAPARRHVAPVARHAERPAAVAKATRSNGSRASIDEINVRDAKRTGQEIDKAVERTGRLDGLINDAGGRLTARGGCNPQQVEGGHGHRSQRRAAGRRMLKQKPREIASYARVGGPGAAHSVAARLGSSPSPRHSPLDGRAIDKSTPCVRGSWTQRNRATSCGRPRTTRLLDSPFRSLVLGRLKS